MKRKSDVLYKLVQQRPMPEDVAAVLIEDFHELFTPAEQRPLKQTAALSWRARLGQLSSMAAVFKAPIPMTKSVDKAAELFPVVALTAVECADPLKLQAYLQELSGFLAKQRAGNSFKTDRLDRAGRKKAKVLWQGHRAYNKRFRLLTRMEAKQVQYLREVDKYALTRMSKSGLATDITEKDFGEHLPTACFLAYYTARMNRRSMFTNKSQSRAFDAVSEMLFDKLRRCPKTRWDLVATVLPTGEVLSRLTQKQRGTMLAKAWEGLLLAASILEPLVKDQAGVNLSTMIVQKGVDSTTWNQAAGAWNNLRAAWVGLVHSLGMSYVLDKGLCPGKVMRMMAADVAAWHRASGGDVHPNTKIWAVLPKPWEVLSGDVLCTREMVRRACQENGVDPDTWLEAKGLSEAEETQVTPELVHGVTVTSSGLALVLRKAGVFSGKQVDAAKLLETQFSVERDEHGAALRATEPPLRQVQRRRGV